MEVQFNKVETNRFSTQMVDLPDNGFVYTYSQGFT